MYPLREPDPELAGFQLSAYGNPRAGWGRAFARLNAVPMTLDQIMRGSSSGCAHGPESDGHLDNLRIRAFCEAENLLPADVAAEAIIVRWAAMFEARFEGGFGIFKDDPRCAIFALHELSADQDAIQFMGAR